MNAEFIYKEGDKAVRNVKFYDPRVHCLSRVRWCSPKSVGNFSHDSGGNLISLPPGSMAQVSRGFWLPYK